VGFLVVKWTVLEGDSVMCFSDISYHDDHTYSLLTPWCRVLLEKLTGLQLVKKFPTFHRTRRFITALISVRHLSVSWARPIQSIYPHPTSWRSILTLSTHLCLGLPMMIIIIKIMIIWNGLWCFPIHTHTHTHTHTHPSSSQVRFNVEFIMERTDLHYAIKSKQ